MPSDQTARDLPVPSDDELIAMQARGELPSDDELETADRMEGREREGTPARAYTRGQVARSHEVVTTLEELDALDELEMLEAFLYTERGDPEPGMNRSRSFHHGWRTRMMDLGEIPIPPEHRALTRLLAARERARKNKR